MQKAAATAAAAAEQDGPPGTSKDQKISLAILRYPKKN